MTTATAERFTTGNDDDDDWQTLRLRLRKKLRLLRDARNLQEENTSRLKSSKKAYRT